MDTPKSKLTPFDYVSIGFASLAALGALMRMAGSGDYLNRLNETTLTYIAVAGALLMLPKIKTLSFGNTKIELLEKKVEEAEKKVEEAEKKVDEVSKDAQMAVDMSRMSNSTDNRPVGKKGPSAEEKAGVAASAPSLELQALVDFSPGEVENDPWKGVFGGNAEANGRVLDAEVSESVSDSGWYRVRLVVRSIDPKAHPLRGNVRFFIHDTFANNKPVVPVIDGIAELRFSSYGAFTVGALADEGATRLELDMEKVSSLPQAFRER